MHMDFSHILSLYWICSNNVSVFTFSVFLAMICGISGSLAGDWNVTLCTGPPVHKFLSLYIKNRYFQWRKDLKGRLGGAGERKRHIPPPEYCRKLLSQEHQAPVTAAGRAPCELRDPVWSGCLGAAGQSSWGVRIWSPSACDPFSLTPLLSLLSYTLGSHCLTDTFLKKMCSQRAFWHPLLLRGLQPTEFSNESTGTFFKDQNSWVESMTQWKARPTGLTV